LSAAMPTLMHCGRRKRRERGDREMEWLGASQPRHCALIFPSARKGYGGVGTVAQSWLRLRRKKELIARSHLSAKRGGRRGTQATTIALG
jgi:hypothetical protein